MKIDPSRQYLAPALAPTDSPQGTAAQKPIPLTGTPRQTESLAVSAAQGQAQTQLSLGWDASERLRAAQALHAAMQGLGTSEWNIERILSNLSPAQRAEVETEFNQRYPEVWGNLRQALKSELSGRDLHQAQRLLDQAQGPDTSRWKALELHQAMRGMGTDEETVYRILETSSTDELLAIQAAFAGQFSGHWGGGLRTALYDDFSGDELARALRSLDLAELNANQGQATRAQIEQAAQALHRAMKGMGTDQDALFRVLETFSGPDLLAIDRVFTEKHGKYWGGNLETALRDDLSGQDLIRALRPLQLARSQAQVNPAALRLIAVLETGNDRSVRHQIGAPELALASPQQKVELLKKLLKGATGDEDERAILRILQSGSEAAQQALIEALAQQNLLSKVLADIHGAEYDMLLDKLPQLVKTPAGIQAVFEATSGYSDRRHKLMLHRLLDTARQQGSLSELAQQIRPAQAMQATVLQEALALAERSAPVIVAHRGTSPQRPENTLPALEATLRNGITSLEIDICMTRDGQLILWHDQTPNSFIANLRQNGWEPDMLFKPSAPLSDTLLRKPTHKLDLQQIREHYGYKGPDGKESVEIPELRSALQLFKKHPHLQSLYLDTKIPDDPALQRRYAQALKTLITELEKELPELRQRIVIMNTERATLQLMKELLPPAEGFQYAHDREDLNRFAWLGLRSSEDLDLLAQSDGQSHLSAGNPKSPVGHSYQDYLALMARTRQALDRQGSSQRLVSWTINDELMLRELLAAGVDDVMTDDPEGFLKLVQTMGLQKP